MPDREQQHAARHEPWVVEAHVNRQSDADELKRLVRKPVSFSGGGGQWPIDIGWSYATKTGAVAAVRRLRQRGGATVSLIDLR